MPKNNLLFYCEYLFPSNHIFPKLVGISPLQFPNCGILPVTLRLMKHPESVIPYTKKRHRHGYTQIITDKTRCYKKSDMQAILSSICRAMNCAPTVLLGCTLIRLLPFTSLCIAHRSHSFRGNAFVDALRPVQMERHGCSQIFI